LLKEPQATTLVKVKGKNISYTTVCFSESRDVSSCVAVRVSDILIPITDMAAFLWLHVGLQQKETLPLELS